MQQKVIRQLNQLNQQFYEKIALDFSASRNFAWQGWEKIIKIWQKNRLKPEKIQVLDIACGNGRLAEFLKEKKLDFDYCGLDNAPSLLAIAKDSLAEKKIEAKLINFDLIATYLKNQEITWPLSQQFDLITVFGLSHHLPSQDLRRHFFQSLLPLLKNDGLLAISNWQFATEERFAKNILNWQKILENPEINLWQKLKLKKLLKNLENHDYLLDWRRFQETSNKSAVQRYCHHLCETEMQELMSQTGWEIVEQFLADGKSGQLNAYFVLKKRS